MISGRVDESSSPVAQLEVGTPVKQRPDLVAALSPSQKWGAHLDLEGKLGNNRDLGEADVFLPLWQDSTSLLFGNIKARLDDNASREGNFGLGLRHMLESGWNVGTYGYFDRRRTETHSYFNQATFGAEALSLDWDLRVNAYVPAGRRTHEVGTAGGTSTAALVGTTVQVTTTAGQTVEEKSLRGFDAEIGWRAPLFSPAAGQQLRLYGGAYRFYADGVNPVQGPRVRTELTFDEVPYLWEGSRLTLGAEAQHDGPRGKTGFVTARLRIPLQFFGGTTVASLTPMERRMTDPVIRDIDIVSQSRTVSSGTTSTETATAVSGGGTLSVLDSGTTNGQANIQTALTNAGANSTVILSGTFATAATVTLQSGQTLMGNGSVTVQTPSGRTATLTTSTGATFTSTGAGNTGTIAMAANSSVKGLTISAQSGGAQAIAIRVNGVSGASILNNTISATAAASDANTIQVQGAGSTNLTISGNTISGEGAGAGNRYGLDIGGGGSGTISNNTITAKDGTSLNSAIQVSNGTYTVSGNTLSATDSGDNRVVDTAGVTYNAGSTGNVLSAGACINGGGNTGSVSFTNSTTCP